MSAPAIPPDLGFRLEAFLKWVRSRILAIEKKLGVVEDDTGGPTDTGVFASGLLVPIAPVSVASGAGTQSWTTYDASGDVPEGATIAWVQGRVEVGSSGDQGSIDVRSESGGSTYPRLQTAAAQSNTDTDSNSALFWVPLSSGRTFDYQVTGTLSGTDSAWSLELHGYQ